jgi:hypothetical protein
MCKFARGRKGYYGRPICTHPKRVTIYCWNHMDCDIVKCCKATVEEIYGISIIKE